VVGPEWQWVAGLRVRRVVRVEELGVRGGTARRRRDRPESSDNVEKSLTARTIFFKKNL
jgi:hypothetical protein